MNDLRLTLSLFCLLLLVCGGSLAATVYKTVDENGIVTYSDIPPAEGTDAETLHIDATEPVSPAQYEERLDAMRETTDRMVADRQAREQQRAQLKAASEPAATLDPTRVYQQSGYDDAGDPQFYPYPLTHPYWRRPHRPHAVPPVGYPPLRPDAGSSGQRNSQLMRPLVSGDSRAARRGTDR